MQGNNCHLGLEHDFHNNQIYFWWYLRFKYLSNLRACCVENIPSVKMNIPSKFIEKVLQLSTKSNS